MDIEMPEQYGGNAAGEAIRKGYGANPRDLQAMSSCQIFNDGLVWKTDMPGWIKAVPLPAEQLCLPRMQIRHSEEECSARPQKRLDMSKRSGKIRQVFHYKMHGYDVDAAAIVRDKPFQL